jgi:type II secretory pathway pseudopilin PulG
MHYCADILKWFISPQGQRGAMFGMDARVALIVMAILAAVGGWQMMSRLESTKVDQAEQQTILLREGLTKYYQTVGINRLPDTLEDLFRNNIITDPSLRKDPWGNPWEYFHGAATLRIEDTPVTVQFAVVFSRGKNTIDDSGGFSSLEEFGSWELRKDDIGTKYTSREIEVARLSEYRTRASLIIDKLESAESANYLEAQGTCNSEQAPTWCSDVEGKNYTALNYYPKTDADDTSGVVYYTDKVLNKKIYSSGNIDDMQQLMIDLGLPASYAQDPWGRVLMLNSNITARTDPPFSASLCFSAGENCLSRRE